jgi:uncharacterized membrane protein YjjP (DUF1212 family)
LTQRRHGDRESGEPPQSLPELQAFIVQLGAAMNTAGEPVFSIQERLTEVARANGAPAARISAFPTYMLVTMGLREPATVELTSSLAATPRLDQIAALDRLVTNAEHGRMPPTEGMERLREIRRMRPRFGPVQSVIGYAILTVGICLVLHPAPREVAAAAVFGALVGFLQSLETNESALRILTPIVAAFAVSALGALAVKHDLTEPGLRAMVASLVIFLPGATLTTAVLELAAGQMISGSARLVSGVVQLALLTFGILAGIQAVGVSSASVFAGSATLLGAWAPWLGVLVFAAGVTLAYSAPARSFGALLIVLYAAWIGQVVGNALLGGFVSAFVGALVMTPVATWVARLPSAMPPYASFLPGYWLLVPGALGLIGLTELAGNPGTAGTQDLVATVVSLFAVALGVLCGTLLLAGARATGKLVQAPAQSPDEEHQLLRRVLTRLRRKRSPDTGDGRT